MIRHHRPGFPNKFSGYGRWGATDDPSLGLFSKHGFNPRPRTGSDWPAR
ncbi:hypothetical protein [Azospirillum doebereinerae]